MKPRKIIRVTLLLIVTAVIVWGCHTPGRDQKLSPKADTIYIQMMQFKPTVLTVGKYDTIVWINQDLVRHNVTAFPDKSWTSGDIQMDSSWTKVITVTDSLNYFCTLHPTMKGTIIVRE